MVAIVAAQLRCFNQLFAYSYLFMIIFVSFYISIYVLILVLELQFLWFLKQLPRLLDQKKSVSCEFLVKVDKEM